MRGVIIASLAAAASLAIPAASATAGGGGWSKPATLVHAGNLTYQPTVAITPNGTTIVVWIEYDSAKNKYSLMDAVRTPQGKISKATLAPAANAFQKPALAVGGDGTVAIAWAYPGSGPSDSSLAVKIMAPGTKRFGATTKVSGSSLSNDYGAGDAPSVAVDDSGSVFVVYVGKFGHYQVVERQKPKGKGKWSSPLRLSSGGTDSHGARVAADGNGAVAVSWAEQDTSVWAVTKSSATARFGAAQKIAGVTYESSPPSVGTSDKGKSALLWEQSGSKGTHQIVSKVGHGRFPSKAQALSTGSLARYQAVAIASKGSGAAAWEDEVAGGWEIDASSLSASGTSWGKGKRLTATGYAATFGAAPTVAANDQRAVVAWSQKDLHHASFIGVSVRKGSSWSNATNFPGLNTPAVAVPNDPSRSPVAGAMIWLSTKGLQISVLK